MPISELSTPRCHYEILGIPQDADTAAIKKAHRSLALKFHPDKNLGDEGAAEKFRLVQQAYEVLSDIQERKWYDDHRDAILAGWSSGDNSDGHMMLFQVAQFMHPGCYSGYHNEKGGFFFVYGRVFEEIAQLERQSSHDGPDLPTNFGTPDTNWSSVQNFYHEWESFVSQLNFAWADKYNANEDAPNRRIRRLMEEDNKKARRNAKKIYNQDILALVAFVKRRDPRVIANQMEIKKEKEEKIKKQKNDAIERKREKERAKEAWIEETQREKEMMEEEDRLAGRVRLADLEDDYDYGVGGGGKKRGKKKKKGRGQNTSLHDEADQNDDQFIDAAERVNDDGLERRPDVNINPETTDQDSQDFPHGEQSADPSPQDAKEVIMDRSIVGEEDDSHFNDTCYSQELGPDVWRCECCGKDFKSKGQLENHLKSKKHKENHKKFLARVMADMMEELEIGESDS